MIPQVERVPIEGPSNAVAVTLTFMQRARAIRRAGHEPMALIDRADAAAQEGRAQEIVQRAAGMTARQQEVEAILQPIVERAAAVDSAEADRALLEATQRRVEELHAVQERLQGGLRVANGQLQRNQEDLQQLRVGFGDLQRQLANVPPRGEADLLRAGGIACRFVAHATTQGHQT